MPEIRLNADLEQTKKKSVKRWCRFEKKIFFFKKGVKAIGGMVTFCPSKVCVIKA